MPPALKILLVDSAEAAVAIEGLLANVQEFDFKLDQVNAPAEASQKLGAGGYDAVLTNISLFGSQANSAVADMRQAAPAVPIVTLSSSADSHLIPEVMAIGADNFLINETADGNRIALAVLYARQKRNSAKRSLSRGEVFLAGLEAELLPRIEAEKLSRKEALSALVTALEGYQKDLYRASVLLHRDGKLYLGGAPGLPEQYNNYIEGMKIGPSAGSCGTAAHFRQTIYVVDIESDPLWRDFKGAALPHNLKACWSVPIIDDEGVLHGTFAMYYDQRRFPSEDERALIHAAAKTAAHLIKETV